MRNVFGWSTVGVVLLSGLAVAQQQPRPTQPNVRPQPAQPGVQQPGVQQNQGSADQQIAALIVGCNRNEVAAAKFAMDKLQSSEAKEIATMLIKDHTEAIQKFSKWSGQAASGPASGTRETGRRDDAQRSDDVATKPAAPPANPGVAAPANQPQPRVALKPAAQGELNWVALHNEIGEEALASSKKELSKYEGNEFDKAFLGHQIAGHLKASAELRVLKRHASSELASEIDKAIETTDSHLKHIRELMDDKKEEKSDSKK